MAGTPTLPIVGEWTLKSARFDFSDTDEFFDIYGPRPTGRLIVTAAGRFTALLTAGDRAPPATPADAGALFSSMMAYCGDYVVEDDKITVQVDVSQHPAWVGQEQVRFFEVKGDDLTLRTPLQPHPGFSDRMGQGVLRWARAA